ncbi:MAG: substrate-binding domain-containing protein, partial [Actinobacteria bacterium]|nr:substrate-binding domain-containing protein [Actinomycetota bacterium]
ASGFLPASAISSSHQDLPRGDGSPSRVLSPLAPISASLVIAGCDPATALLGPLLERASPPVDLLWWPCSSSRALSLLQAGLVHAAGIHLADPASGTYNRQAARAALGSLGAEVLGFTTWREGIVLAPHHRKQVKGVGDIARLGLRVVQREPGSEARALLERELYRAGLDLDTFGPTCAEAPGHLEVAAAVAWGLADAGIASEPAALAYEMAFVPLATERYDLVVANSSIGSVEVQALLRALGSSWLAEQLGSLSGYDAIECGRIVDSF